MPSFHIITLGCKVNQYDSQAISQLLQDRGLDRRDELSRPADLVVVNTCCVTQAALAKSRQAVRRAAARNPAARLVIVGCAASRHQASLARAAWQAGAAALTLAGHDQDIVAAMEQAVETILAGADCSSAAAGGLVAPRNEECMKAGAPAAGPSRNIAAESITPQPPCHVNCSQPALGPIRDFPRHQRAFLKVQDGCDAFCAYCIVPHVRKHPHWRPVEQILAEAAALVAAGFPEIVLCGVFLGAYGQPTAVRRNWQTPPQLPSLVERLCGVPGLRRLRLSSLDAGDVSDELVEVAARNENCLPHFHLPLQSGSDRVLSRMNRQYDSADFLAAVRRLGRRLENPAVTTDVIVGFPGEDETDFEATLEICRQAAFSRIHIFPFSAQPGTPAWQWRREGPAGAIVRQRCRRLRELQQELSLAYRRQFIGQVAQVVVELPSPKTPPGIAHGLTERYLEAEFPSAAPPRSLVAVRITGLTPTGLTGRQET